MKITFTNNEAKAIEKLINSVVEHNYDFEEDFNKESESQKNSKFLSMEHDKDGYHFDIRSAFIIDLIELPVLRDLCLFAKDSFERVSYLIRLYKKQYREFFKKWDPETYAKIEEHNEEAAKVLYKRVVDKDGKVTFEATDVPAED